MSELPDRARFYLEKHYPGYQTTPLKQGLNNRVWRITHGADDLLLRLHTSGYQPNQTRRQIEQWAWGQAAKAGLAPELVYWCPEHSFSLCQFVERIGQVNRLVWRLVALHQLPINQLQTINYQQQLSQQLQNVSLPAKDKADWQSKLDEWIMALNASRLQRCFTHHDLNLENLIPTNTGVMFIDFEYVALGHPLWDLAACEDTFSSEKNDVLWQQYLELNGVGVSSQERLAWQAAQKLYHLSCWLWFLYVGVESEAVDRHYAALTT